nr:DUF4328 domain-containing protein [Tepidiforma sp.]
MAGIAVALSGLAALVGLSIDDEEAWETVDGVLTFYAVAALLSVVTAVLIVAWTRRVTGNLKPFGADLELGTGWAVGAFFTPIIMLWFPVRLWNQAWRATSPNLPPPIGRNYKRLPGRHLHWVMHAVWWANIVAQQWYLEPTDWTAIEFGSYFGILSGGIGVTLFLAILLVRGLTARQDTYARIWAAAPPAASPAPPGG